MALGSPKVSIFGAAFPAKVSTIAIAIGGLASFFVFGLLLRLSYPIGSSVSGVFYGNATPELVQVPLSLSNHTVEGLYTGSDVSVSDQNLTSHSSSGSGPDAVVSENIPPPGLDSDKKPLVDGKEEADEKKIDVGSGGGETNVPKAGDTPSVVSSSPHDDSKTASAEPGSGPDAVVSENIPPPGLDSDKKPLVDGKEETDEKKIDVGSGEGETNVPKAGDTPSVVSSSPHDDSKTASSEPECDLYQGSWFYDPEGPVYTNNSCPVITQMQNCQGNGRSDKGYENWRWKPSQCDLPRFDAKKFLELMRGKTLAFIGDSVARNQMESMLCLLWQVETPVNRGSRKMQRWLFKSSSVMIARIWSSWLVHQFNEKFDYAPEGVTKLKLDRPDERIIEALPKFDVVVLSSGHWFAKQSVYILNDEIVGGQLWWPDKSKPMKVNNVEAFGISVETILKSVATHPNYTGLTIVRTWSPDHYEGGAWNTGGSCTGKEEPILPGKLVKNGFTEIMHEKQATGFNRAVEGVSESSKVKLKLMDITEAFGYRHDGHPGPYRSPDPNKITKRGPDGRPPPQDCLHWCMPGPVDTWNEMVLELIRRDVEGGKRNS